MADVKPAQTPPLALADLQDERLIEQQGLVPVLQGFWNRIKGGDLGSLPVIIGLAVILTVFYTIEPVSMSSRTLVSNLRFAAPLGIIALGIVLVLLVGEIDLSVGALSGFAAASMTVLLVEQDRPLPVAMAVGIGIGVAVGVFYAALYNWIGVPSFVFSLAGLLAFQGALLKVLGDKGTITLPNDSWLIQFARFGYVDPTTAYVIVLAITTVYLGAQLWERRRRAASELSTVWFPLVIAKTALLGGGLLWLTWYLNVDRGWPKVWLLFSALVVGFDLLLRRTRWGRHVFAVGGNEEAARRSGIKVARIYLSVFIGCSTLAAFGGLMAAGVFGSVSQATGTVDTNLTAISAAVIGGTSLFGGRGSAYSAMFGILVLQSINSGLNLTNVDSSVRFMITGGVLLLAVGIDSISRKRREASGRG